MARPRATSGPDSRARLLAAASADFAAHGYAGASVDRIARRARLTKAMVYYHFRSKEGLYAEIIREATGAIARRVELALAEAPTLEAQLVAFVRAFAEEAILRPDFPRLLMRELAEQGRHMDAETARAWLAVPAAFMRIYEDGVARGRFQAVHPMVAYLSIVGPVVLLLASAPARRRIARVARVPTPDMDPRAMSAEIQQLALGLLAVPGASPQPSQNGERHESRLPPDRVNRQPADGRHGRHRVP